MSQKDFDYFIGITKEDLVSQLRKILKAPKPIFTDKDQRFAYEENRSLIYPAITSVNYLITPKLKNLSALELHKLFLKDDDELFINMYREMQRYKDAETSDPKWKIYNPSPFELLEKIEVKPDDVEVKVQGLPGIIAIGFHCKNGITTFEYLNANSILKGKTYQRSSRTGDLPFSLWFE